MFMLASWLMLGPIKNTFARIRSSIFLRSSIPCRLPQPYELWMQNPSTAPPTLVIEVPDAFSGLFYSLTPRHLHNTVSISVDQTLVFTHCNDLN
jgi:hypothetical protein